MRALLLAFALVALGCGDDTTSAAASIDLSQPLLDFASVAPTCGVSICSGTCSGCIPLGGGVCVPPCTTANPSSCTAPATCHPIVDPDGGPSATLVGSCSPYDGYCG